jgi:hypothetical protein
MFLGKRCRMVAVKDRDDDDQSDGVGKGKLRVLGVFGNPSKCVGSRDGTSGSGSLISIKFELLISIAMRSKVGPKRRWKSLAMNKRSIGAKQYLDYL